MASATPQTIATLPLAVSLTGGEFLVADQPSIISGGVQQYVTVRVPLSQALANAATIGAAGINSPTFTGLPAAPTAAQDTNTTQLATTAFVIAQAGTASPLVNGTAAAGTSLRYSRQDHVHPTDTSRAATTVTITGTGALTGGGDLSASRTLAVAPSGITNSLLANMAANSLKGNNTGASAGATDLTVAQVLALLGSAVLEDGNCRLAYISSTSVGLSPYKGNALVINGVSQTIPASLTLSNSGLAATTLYWVYAWMNGATMTLEASTTGHTTDAFGRENKTGDTTRRFVGMVYTNSGGAFQDTPVLRGVWSYFNRRNIIAYAAGAGSGTTSSTYIQYPSTNVIVITSPDEAMVQLMPGYATNTVSGALNSCVSFIDNSASGQGVGAPSNTAGGQCSLSNMYSNTLSEGAHSVAVGIAVSAGNGTFYLTNTVITRG